MTAPQIVGLIILILVAFGIVSSLIGAYNKLILLKNNIAKSFANIDVLLKQRADEIPNLVMMVKESMKYEQGILEKLTAMRTRYLSASSMDEKVDVSNEMTHALKNVFAVSENYPELKTSSSFLSLQKRVSELEDTIADRREFYNESANMYNIGISEFPPVVLGKMLEYKSVGMFDISEKEKEYNGVQF